MIIGRSSTKFLFFMPIGNPRWLPPQVIVLTQGKIQKSACPQVFSSGGTCTLLPSLLGVHQNFWGCNVPSNSSFGGYKENELHFSHFTCPVFVYVGFFKHMK
jgi:hypothetical protein